MMVRKFQNSDERKTAGKRGPCCLRRDPPLRASCSCEPTGFSASSPIWAAKAADGTGQCPVAFVPPASVRAPVALGFFTSSFQAKRTGCDSFRQTFSNDDVRTPAKCEPRGRRNPTGGRRFPSSVGRFLFRAREEFGRSSFAEAVRATACNRGESKNRIEMSEVEFSGCGFVSLKKTATPAGQFLKSPAADLWRGICPGGGRRVPWADPRSLSVACPPKRCQCESGVCPARESILCLSLSRWPTVFSTRRSSPRLNDPARYSNTTGPNEFSYALKLTPNHSDSDCAAWVCSVARLCAADPAREGD